MRKVGPSCVLLSRLVVAALLLQNVEQVLRLRVASVEPCSLLLLDEVFILLWKGLRSARVKLRRAALRISICSARDYDDARVVNRASIASLFREQLAESQVIVTALMRVMHLIGRCHHHRRPSEQLVILIRLHPMQLGVLILVLLLLNHVALAVLLLL